MATHDPGFAEEARRESQLASESPEESEVMDWIEEMNEDMYNGGMINYGSPADMCDCPVVPVNEWLDRDGQVVESRPLEADTGNSDGEDFLARPDAVGWRIVCPDCRKIYAEWP